MASSLRAIFSASISRRRLLSARAKRKGRAAQPAIVSATQRRIPTVPSVDQMTKAARKSTARTPSAGPVVRVSSASQAWRTNRTGTAIPSLIRIHGRTVAKAAPNISGCDSFSLEDAPGLADVKRPVLNDDEQEIAHRLLAV